MRSLRAAGLGTLLSCAAFVTLLAVPAGAAAASHPRMVGVPETTAATSDSTSTHCYGYFPITGDNSYANDCYGHDEPEIDPISNVNGTGKDITWTIKLPTSSSTRPLLDLGPTFWLSAGLADKYSVRDRVFSELQFYPDSSLLPQQGNNINTACSPLGFNVQPDPGTWSVCDFTWGLYGTAPANWQETPAYVGVLDRKSNPNEPLYLHSGDVVQVHIFNSHDANNDAEQTITDETTGQTGSLIMNSNSTTGAGSAANPNKGDGPLVLPYAANTTKTPFPWGVVIDTPFGFSWEIGHSNFYTHPDQAECVPGQWDCFSYDTTSDGWGAIKPLQIQSVTFNVKGTTLQPQSWGTVDSQGGAAEDQAWCGSYNEPGSTTCTFPWYTYNPGANAVLFGNTYPGTPAKYTWGGALKQYDQVQNCNGPLTAQYGFTNYCNRPLNPSPPIP